MVSSNTPRINIFDIGKEFDDLPKEQVEERQEMVEQVNPFRGATKDGVDLYLELASVDPSKSKDPVSTELRYHGGIRTSGLRGSPPYTYRISYGPIRTKMDYLNGMDASIKGTKEKYSGDEEKNYLNLYLSRFAAHLIGFGKAALKQNDPDSAVRAFKLAESFGRESVQRNIWKYADQGKEQQIALRDAFKRYDLAKG